MLSAKTIMGTFRYQWLNSKRINNTFLNWLTGKVHFLDFFEYSELIVEVMGYYASGYGLWNRKEIHE